MGILKKWDIFQSMWLSSKQYGSATCFYDGLLLCDPHRKRSPICPLDPPTWMLRYSPNTSRYLKTQCVHPLVTRLTWHILVAKIPHLCCWKRSIFTDFLAQETRFDWIIVPYFLFHVIHDFRMFNPCVGGSRWSVWGRAGAGAVVLAANTIVAGLASRRVRGVLVLFSGTTMFTLVLVRRKRWK